MPSKALVLALAVGALAAQIPFLVQNKEAPRLTVTAPPPPKLRFDTLTEHSTAVSASQTHKEDVRVPVTLGVMSQCPDALYCEAQIDKVLDEVAGLVDLGLTFIGAVNTTEPNWGVTCLHGLSECSANVLELCAIAHEPPRPSSDPNWRPLWFDFVLCNNAAGRWGVGTPEVVAACALKTGVALDVIQTCVSDGEGRRLHLESVLATKALGVRNSCTVLINGKKACVRDDNQWKECEGGSEVENFVKQIQHEHERLNES